jgi:hypothetical protein
MPPVESGCDGDCGHFGCRIRTKPRTAFQSIYAKGEEEEGLSDRGDNKGMRFSLDGG